MILFKIVVGDRSRDGHEKSENFIIQSNKPLKEIQKAYKEAKKLFPQFYPEQFFQDYQDRTVPYKIALELEKNGFDMGMVNAEDESDIEIYNPDLAELIVWFIKKGDPELELEILDIPVFKTDNYNVGYGLF